MNRSIQPSAFSTINRYSKLKSETMIKVQQNVSSNEVPAGPVRKINDCVYEFCKPENPTVEIIFFHGLQLGSKKVENPHLNTWTMRDSDEFWPQTLFSKDTFMTENEIRVRALAVCYDSSKFRTDNQGRLDLFNIAENFMHSIIDNPRVKVGLTEGVPVILVGHSFGGLVIKDLLKKVAQKARAGGRNLQTFLDNLGGVFFYSTPHLALRDEVVKQLFKEKGKQYSELVLLFEQLNKHVSRLEMDMKAIVRNYGKNWGRIKVMEVFEAEQTDLGDWKGMIIEEASAKVGGYKGHFIPYADHFSICRPTDETSQSYTALADFIFETVNRAREKPDATATEAVGMSIDLPSVPGRSLQSVD